jgi:hypothetical protein
MADSYKIITDNMSIDDIIAQLRAIKGFPCMVNIYDRVVKVNTEDECDMMIWGLEIGSFLTEDRFEKK